LQPLGMITRKDLAKFRAGTRRGLVKIEHLKIENEWKWIWRNLDF